MLTSNKIRFIALCGVSALIMTGCNSIDPDSTKYSSGANKSNDSEIIIVSILSFEPHGMYDHFSDGTYADYAITVLEVIEPENIRGKRIQIIQDSRLAPGSVWDKVGKECKIELDQRLLRNQSDFISPEDVVINCE